LLSKPHTQPDATLLLLPVGSGAAAAAPYASIASFSAAFQESQHCFEKCQREQGKI